MLYVVMHVQDDKPIVSGSYYDMEEARELCNDIKSRLIVMNGISDPDKMIILPVKLPKEA